MTNLHGIIAINKSAGMTSHDVVCRVRRITGVKKVGHAGTLDPDATGLLLVAIGHGTRLTEYLLDEDKTYRAECTLGTSTSTEDASGEIVEQVACELPSQKDIEAILKSFLGSYEQLPPMYSAIKVDGVPLYRLARKGLDQERSVRTVTINMVELLADSVKSDPPGFAFDVACSKGTYIRTLCVDIGRKFELPAHLSRLVRTRVGHVGLDQAVSLDQLAELFTAGRVDDVLISMTDALPALAAITVDDETVQDIVYNGKELPVDGVVEAVINKQLIKIIDKQNRLVALYRLTAEDKFMPVKVFKYGENNAS